MSRTGGARPRRSCRSGTVGMSSPLSSPCASSCVRDPRGRSSLGPEQRGDRDIGEVQANQYQARHQGARKEMAHRHRLRRKHAEAQLCLLIGARQHVAEQHQRDRRWNDLAECAGRADRAGGELRVVAVAQHGRERQQAEGDHGGADDAGARRHHHADHCHGHAKAAAHSSHQRGEALEQRLRDARALERHAHGDEQRHRDQGLVRDDAEQTPGQEAQVAEIEHAEQRPAEGEQQRHAGERGSHGVAREQRREHHGEHHERQEFDHERSARISRADSTPAWAISSAADSGIKVLRANTAGMPPTSWERSRMDHDAAT